MSVRMLGIGATAACGALFAGACEPTNEGYAPRQPIAFSHAVHAGTNRIPCQYCHYSAERGPRAGFPPVAMCLNCHAQVLASHPEIEKIRDAVSKRRPVAWVRVHMLPDFSYFSHAPHVNAGVACGDCHGAVETMTVMSQVAPLTMGWCIDCHRRKGSAAAADAEAAGPAAGHARANPLTDCSVCHH